MLVNPNRELSRLVIAAQDVAAIDAQADKLETKLLAPAVLLLRACDISAARRLAREHGGAIRHVIRRMSKADLNALSKKWNPHRPQKPTEAFQQDLINELTALAENARQPAVKLPRPKAAPKRRRTNTVLAAE